MDSRHRPHNLVGKNVRDKVRSMALFARMIVGVDGTEWGFEALRQALRLAPDEDSSVGAVTALDTMPAGRTGFEAAHGAGMLTEQAAEVREKAAIVLGQRPGSVLRE